MFEGKARSGQTLRALLMLPNIKLGRKWLTLKNTPAYYSLPLVGYTAQTLGKNNFLACNEYPSLYQYL
jgi:hypothetical protein